MRIDMAKLDERKNEIYQIIDNLLDVIDEYVEGDLSGVTQDATSERWWDSAKQDAYIDILSGLAWRLDPTQIDDELMRGVVHGELYRLIRLIKNREARHG